MRFTIEQLFATDPTSLCAALVDPDYLTNAMARLPDLSAPLLESQHRDVTTGTIRQTLRYRFTGKLPSTVTRFVSPDRLSWTDVSTVDIAGRTASFVITPVHYQHFFSCTGTWSIRAAESGAGALRVLSGSVKVNSPLPFVGGQVEKAIVNGMRDRLAKEPAAFDWWQSERKRL